MPWQRNSEAKGHTKKANTPKKQRQWRKIANKVLEKTGSESAAIRTASGVVARSGKKSKRNTRRSGLERGVGRHGICFGNRALGLSRSGAKGYERMKFPSLSNQGKRDFGYYVYGKIASGSAPQPVLPQ